MALRISARHKRSGDNICPCDIADRPSAWHFAAVSLPIAVASRGQAPRFAPLSWAIAGYFLLHQRRDCGQGEPVIEAEAEPQVGRDNFAAIAGHQNMGAPNVWPCAPNGALAQTFAPDRFRHWPNSADRHATILWNRRGRAAEITLDDATRSPAERRRWRAGRTAANNGEVDRRSQRQLRCMIKSRLCWGRLRAVSKTGKGYEMARKCQWAEPCSRFLRPLKRCDEPLIFIRGLGANDSMAQSFIDYFTAAGLDVIVFDNRDVGGKLDAGGVPDMMAILAGAEAGASAGALLGRYGARCCRADGCAGH